MVPTSRTEQSRRPFLNEFLGVTRPRPLTERTARAAGLFPCRPCPARSCTVDQPAKLRPEAKRAQIVEGDQDHQGEQGSQAGPERPFLYLRPQGFPADGL